MGLDNRKIIVVARGVGYWLRLIGELYMERHDPARFFFLRSRQVFFHGSESDELCRLETPEAENRRPETERRCEAAARRAVP